MSMAQTDMVLQSLEGLWGGIDTLTSKLDTAQDDLSRIDGKMVDDLLENKVIAINTTVEARSTTTILNISGSGILLGLYVNATSHSTVVTADDKTYTFIDSGSIFYCARKYSNNNSGNYIMSGFKDDGEMLSQSFSLGANNVTPLCSSGGTVGRYVFSVTISF